MMYTASNSYEYENGFYLTSQASRIGRAISHYELFKKTQGLNGEIVECGVFKGVSFMRFISFVQLFETAKPRRVIGFDTFGTFPLTSHEKDKAERDEFVRETGGGVSISQEELDAHIRNKGFNRAELIAGDILQTVPDYVRRNPDLKISLLNIDTDIYEPCNVILEWLAPKVVEGGVIVFDDYGVFAGETELANAYALRHGTNVQQFAHAKVPSYLVQSARTE